MAPISHQPIMSSLHAPYQQCPFFSHFDAWHFAFVSMDAILFLSRYINMIGILEFFVHIYFSDVTHCAIKYLHFYITIPHGAHERLF